MWLHNEDGSYMAEQRREGMTTAKKGDCGKQPLVGKPGDPKPARGGGGNRTISGQGLGGRRPAGRGHK